MFVIADKWQITAGFFNTGGESTLITLIMQSVQMSGRAVNYCRCQRYRR
jgi:hypothetical protein